MIRIKKIAIPAPITRLLLACALLLLLVVPASAAEQGEAIRAASFGDGRIAFFWAPTPQLYNGGGWRLSDSTSGAIVASWGPAELERGLAALPTEQQERLRPFIESLATAPESTASGQVGWLMVGGMSDFALARTLGMGCLLENIPAGRHAYTLTIVDARGKALGRGAKTALLDSARATELPAAPAELHGVSGPTGLELYWSQTPADVPTPFFLVSRRTGLGGEELLTPEPLWLGPERTPDAPAWVDSNAPLESRLTYSVRLRDLFGRLSPAAEVSVWHADLEALRPPANLTLKPGPDRVDLSWTGNDNPYTSGYVIERSRRSDGIYQVLTPDGLTAKTNRFTDRDVQGGFSYYYRLRAVGPRGDVGEPSAVQTVSVETSGSPKAPAELKATVEPTRVILNWQAQPLPVGGYIVERRQEGEKTWVRINSGLITRPEFNDAINLGDYGQRSYRVTSVAFDSRKSMPGREVSVKLPGHAPVPAPFLERIDTSAGSVKLKFKASPPRERSARLLLVRGNSADDIGLIIDSAIDAKGTAYTDRLVKPGEDYWYALIAEDREGNRSELGNKLFVIVGSPEIPRPARPVAKLGKEPFLRVTIKFKEPDNFLRTAVMRKIDDGPWVTIARDVAGVDEIVDADPPRSGKLEYRVVYLDESSSWGPPSESVSVEVD